MNQETVDLLVKERCSVSEAGWTR